MRGRTLGLSLALASLAATFVLATPAVPAPAGSAARAPAARPAPKRVVVLYSFPPDSLGEHGLSDGINSTFAADTSGSYEVFTEYTGLDRFSGATYESSLLSLLSEKYARRKVDLIMVVGPSALQFVLAHDFLPGVPVVTSYVVRRDVEAARLKRPDTTGLTPAQNAPPTLELMLRMYPQTRRIHVILGGSSYEREQAERGRKLFQPFEGRVALDYWNDLSLQQMVERGRTLDGDELVLFGSLMQDAAGLEFTNQSPVSEISAASRRPVFGVIAEDMGQGIVGGVLISMELSGKHSAEVALRILRGERASSIPIAEGADTLPMFDWRQLRRWGIRERDLPKGSVVRFEKVSVWDTYWKEISAGVGVIVVESLLVAGLVFQLRRRRETERELAAAEMRHRTVADFTHDWEFWQRPDGSFEYVSPACSGVSGYDTDDFRRSPSLLEQMVLEEDRPAWAAYQRGALEGKRLPPIEYRIKTREGAVRWVEQASNPVLLEGGRFAGTRGSIRDISERKESQLELQRAYEEIRALKDRLEAENTYYREEIRSAEGPSELIGHSDALKYVIYRIRQVAPSDTTVLIQGETGTGKELVADAIHQLSARADRPLVKVNCAALPQGLAESELFGHEKGAFTGAQSQRKGRFELADGATLFLDEVGELPPEVQAKLLRVLQDGQFERVGGTRTLKVAARVIAATNRDLRQEVAAGRFREDLWYRLNVFPITVPTLRQRGDDIPTLAQSFVERTCKRLARPPLAVPQSVMKALAAYPWPGNVRELQNVVERAVLVSDGETLRLADELVATPLPGAARSPGRLQSLIEVETEHIRSVLEATDWKVEGRGGAAEILGMNPSTLRARLRKLNIQRP
jgi:PAS domain S-box-containing protein